MEGSASVTGNTGNGVYVDERGTFTMLGGTISGNTANGVSVGKWGTFTMQAGTISGNTTNGVYVGGTFTMLDGTISSNTGDGVYVWEGTFTMRGGTISGNTNSGVLVYNATFTMQGGTISGNTGRGGVLAAGTGSKTTFTMQGGTISGNTAKEDGGGVMLSGFGTTFTMQGGTISGNTAKENGGGVWVGYNATFTMQSGTSISGNSATYGGGVYVSGGFKKTGGSIYGEDAEQNLKNTAISMFGHVVYNRENGNWRNSSAGPTMNTDSYGFWLNDGDVVMFPTGFVRENWRRSNFNNTLTLTENTIKSSSSNYVWVLQRISGNAYTFKRGDSANTMTITIRLDGNSLVISGDSGNGQDNWNGTWR
jgi:hypothetical protein